MMLSKARRAVPSVSVRDLGGGLLLALMLTCAAGAAAQTRGNPPRPLAARDVKFPPYQLQTLPNGLQVVAVLHHEQPVVSMRMIVRAGGALDPKGKNGLAELAASVQTLVCVWANRKLKFELLTCLAPALAPTRP